MIATAVPAIAARDLSLTHAEAPTPVIEGLDLTIAPAEVIAIIGPSGVGKSSLLRVLAGLRRPDTGTITVGGEILEGVHPRVALAVQDPGLLPWLTMEKNAAFGLDFKRQPVLSRQEAKSRVDWAIREVDLNHARGLYPAALSGGMAQRVALARCLVRKPSVLLLDEPFGALDEVTRADMQRLLLRAVADVGAATILVTHDLDEAIVLADRIVLLSGSPANITREWQIPRPKGQRRDLEAFGTLRGDIFGALRRSIHYVETVYA